MMITIVLYLFLKTIFVSLQSYSFLSAYKKSVLIGYDLVFLRKRILASDNTVITYITIPAGSTTDQCTVKLFNTKEITVTHKREHMQKIMLLCKLRIRALSIFLFPPGPFHIYPQLWKIP